MTNDRTPPPRFILKGFSQDQGFRQFAFEGAWEGMEEARMRTQFTVRADLALIRTYGIPIQDLPLLCRDLLDQRADVATLGRLTFTEDDMRLHRDGRVAAQQALVKKKKLARRPPTENAGNAWRTTSPLSMQSRA